MALRTIVKDGDPILKKVCRPVTKFDDRLATLLDDMQDTLVDADGLGLAGPQVGMMRRIFICLDDRNRPEDAPIGLIPIDSLYSPVRKVSYKVENTREGQDLDLDKLTLTVETDGSVKPEDAVAYAARILQDQLPLIHENQRIRQPGNIFHTV